MIYRVLELETGRLVYETNDWEKAKNYADLYKKNLKLSCIVQKCETVWSTETLDELLN